MTDDTYQRVLPGLVQVWELKQCPSCAGCGEVLGHGTAIETVQTVHDVPRGNRLEQVVDRQVTYRAGCGPFPDKPDGAPRLCHRALEHVRDDDRPAADPAPRRRGRKPAG